MATSSFGRSSGPMSDLGQKQTCAAQHAVSALPPIATAKADMPQMVMSALSPKADVCGAQAHVCFGPIAVGDIAQRWWTKTAGNTNDFES